MANTSEQPWHFSSFDVSVLIEEMRLCKLRMKSRLVISALKAGVNRLKEVFLCVSRKNPFYYVLI